MSLVQEIVHAAGTPERSEPTDWLEPVPRQILSRLRRARADRRAALRAIGAEVTEQRERYQRQAGLVQRLVSREHDGFGYTPTDERVVAAEQEHARMKAELAELVAAERERSQAAGNASRVVEACERALSRAIATFSGPRSGRTLPEIIVKPRLERNERPIDAINRLRKRIDEIGQELEDLQRLPPANRKETLHKAIAALAAKGRPAIASDGTPSFPEERIRSQVFIAPPAPSVAPVKDDDDDDSQDGGKLWDRVAEKANKQITTVPRPLGADRVGADGFGAAQVTDTLAVLAWLFPTELTQRLERELGDEPANAITDVERERQRGVLEAELLQVQRLECALIAQANDADGLLAIDYRVGVDGRAVLRL